MALEKLSNKFYILLLLFGNIGTTFRGKLLKLGGEEQFSMGKDRWIFSPFLWRGFSSGLNQIS